MFNKFGNYLVTNDTHEAPFIYHCFTIGMYAS